MQHTESKLRQIIKKEFSILLEKSTERAHQWKSYPPKPGYGIAHAKVYKHGSHGGPLVDNYWWVDSGSGLAIGQRVIKDEGLPNADVVGPKYWPNVPKIKPLTAPPESSIVTRRSRRGLKNLGLGFEETNKKRGKNMRLSKSLLYKLIKEQLQILEQ